MNCRSESQTNRRQYLLSLGTIVAAGASTGVSGCSSGGSEEEDLVTVQNHGRGENVFYVKIKNGHPVEEAEVTVVLELRDGSGAVIARAERRVTIDSGTSRRIDVEVQSGDVDGDLDDVESYSFELDGEHSE